MTSAIASLVVVLLLMFMTYAGARDGLFFTTYALVRNLLAFLFAMTFCEPLGSLLARVVYSKHPGPEFCVPVAFALLFAGVFLLGRWLKMSYTIPRVECPQLVDRIAGPFVGLASGIIATGALLVLWSLFPFVRYVPGDLGHIKPKVDTGVAMLRFYGYVEKRMGGGKPFLLEDETVDPDLNNNGRWDLAGEKFTDDNLNGEWDRGWLWRYHTHADVYPVHLEPLNLGESITP